MYSPAKRAIVIGMDGASMELVKNMADWGHVPNIARLMKNGVYRPMLGVFPTLTPPGWTSLCTGAWPGTHEVMDFNIRAVGKRLDETVWGINTGLCKSEYLWNLVERVGRNPILVKWEMSWPPTVTTGMQVEGTGPGVSNYHQIAGYHLFVGGKWAPRPIGGTRDPETVDPSALQGIRNVDPVAIESTEGKGFDTTSSTQPKGWSHLPESDMPPFFDQTFLLKSLPPLEVKLTIQPLARGRIEMGRRSQGTPKPFWGLIYASGTKGYDRVRICRSRNGNDMVTELAVGQWSDWWLDSFQIDGLDVEGYVRMKLINLSPTADMFELFVPQIWPREGYTYPAELAHGIDEHVGSFLQNPARDALGVIDDDTYFELLEYHHQRLADVAQYLSGKRQWDLLMVETHASDYANHFFLGQSDEESGASAETIKRCRDGLARTYASIDRMVGRLMELADDKTVIVLGSDHGGTPNRFRPVNITQVLEEAGFIVYKEGTGRRREIDWSKTRAVNVGLVHIFINLKGREPDGIVEPEDYEATQREIIAVLHTYQDPKTGQYPFALALTRADAEMLNLWGDLVGDVVYALRPDFDGAHGKHLPSSVLGIGGQHSTFVLSGAGVRKGEATKGQVALRRQVRVVDIAPTLCYLLGLPMPADIEGGIVYEALENPDWALEALEKLTGS